MRIQFAIFIASESSFISISCSGIHATAEICAGVRHFVTGQKKMQDKNLFFPAT
jgi:L-cysteine desulfidase